MYELEPVIVTVFRGVPPIKASNGVLGVTVISIPSTLKIPVFVASKL
jgi:hypothetical protein